MKDSSTAHQQVSHDVLRELKRLEIRSRRLADADLVGSYRTAFRGTGLTFSELREYQAGDDVRHIHWKATARGKTAYVKTYEEDRQLNIVLALDMSRSMLYGSPRSKLARARELCALITTLARKTQDNVSLCLFADDIIEYLPLRTGRKQVMRVLYTLFEDRIQPPETRIDIALSHLLLHLKKTSVIFLISDFLTKTVYDDELSKVSSRHDLICVEIADPNPSLLPRAGLITLVDAESGAKRVIDSSDKRVRTALKEQSLQHSRHLDSLCKRVKADAIRIEDTLEPLTNLMKYRSSRIQIA